MDTHPYDETCDCDACADYAETSWSYGIAPVDQTRQGG